LLDRVGLASTLKTSAPTTDVPAYVLPSAPGVEIAPILTAGDAAARYIYIGNKQAQGNEIERAGLTNGKLYGVKVFLGDTHVTEESNDFGLGSAATGFVEQRQV